MHVESENVHGKMFVKVLSERVRFQNHTHNKSIIFKNIYMKRLEWYALKHWEWFFVLGARLQASIFLWVFNFSCFKHNLKQYLITEKRDFLQKDTFKVPTFRLWEIDAQYLNSTDAWGAPLSLIHTLSLTDDITWREYLPYKQILRYLKTIYHTALK